MSWNGTAMNPNPDGISELDSDVESEAKVSMSEKMFQSNKWANELGDDAIGSVYERWCPWGAFPR